MPLVLGVERGNVREEDLRVDVAPELLDLDGLLPEVEDVDGVLQHLHDAQHQLLQRLPVFGRHFAAVEGELHHVVVEGGRFLGQALDGLGASLHGLLAELLVVLGQRLPVVAVLLDELLQLLAERL